MSELRQVVVALNTASLRRVAQDAKDDPFEDAALAVMRESRDHFMAPTEDEAFVSAVGALMEAFPDLPIMQEATAIGDRAKTLAAVLGGVPVDMEAAEAAFTPFPDPPLDLVALWQRSLAA